MTKVGVAGLGRQRMLNFSSCFQIPDERAFAVSDESEKALAKAQSFGVNHVYRDYGKMFKSHSDLDAVTVSLPNFLLLESIQLALENGFGCFC